MVTQLPSSDETSVSKKQLLARLDVCMGGRVAEELIFGQDHITTGASSDLQTATELAQYMVSLNLPDILDSPCVVDSWHHSTPIILFIISLDVHPQVSNCGMSESIGPIHIKEQPSAEMQSRIDAEV